MKIYFVEKVYAAPPPLDFVPQKVTQIVFVENLSI